MKEYEAEIIENKKIAEGVRSLRFRLPEEAKTRAGQFANLSVGGAHLLRRPLAICKTDGREITVCFQIKGEGTKLLAAMGTGTRLNVLMPLGNGFFLRENERKVALVGGGVGIFPMISVIREYAAKKQISAYMGFRTKAAVCGLEELQRAERLVAVTDDGSFGEKKNAVQAFEADLADPALRPDVVLACGPLPMLRAVHSLPQLTGGQFSFEARMGCGFGACMGCTVPTANGSKRVCKDGPILYKEEIVW